MGMSSDSSDALLGQLAQRLVDLLADPQVQPSNETRRTLADLYAALDRLLFPFPDDEDEDEEGHPADT